MKEKMLKGFLWMAIGYLVLSAFFRIFFYRPHIDSGIHYVVGTDSFYHGTYFDASAGWAALQDDLQEERRILIDQVCFCVYYYPVGWVEALMMKTDFDDPALVLDVKNLLKEQHFPEGTLLVFGDRSLDDGYVILEEGTMFDLRRGEVYSQGEPSTIVDDFRSEAYILSVDQADPFSNFTEPSLEKGDSPLEEKD